MNEIDMKALKASFNKAAKTYDEYNFLQKHVGNELISRLDFIKLKPQRILEIGCGTGFCTSLLQNKFPEANIVAIDIAEMMVQRAKKKNHSNKIAYICADTHALPFANFTFDLIFSNLTLQWVIDLDKLFMKWLEVIKPEGSIIFSSFGKTTLQELQLSWDNIDQYTHTNEFSDIFSIGNHLMKAHWENPVLDADEIILEYRDINQIFIDLKMIGAHNLTENRPHGLMPKNKWQKFIENYKNNFYINHKYQLTYQIMYAHAFAPEILSKVMQAKNMNKINIPIEHSLT
jgi:malonyl-CoA O-methyltransferase